MVDSRRSWDPIEPPRHLTRDPWRRFQHLFDVTFAFHDTEKVLTHRVSVSQSRFPNLPRSKSNTMLTCWDAHSGFSISVFPFPKPKIETSSIIGIWEIGKRKNGNGDPVCARPGVAV